MDSQHIVSQMNSFLHEAATALVGWLNNILPRVSETWWEDCVLSSLSYTQREIAVSRGFSQLSDFDLAALLRITNKSWYDMRTIAYLPTSERETVREMMNVRNNWAHCSASLPGKDTILGDLNTLSVFLGQINGSHAVRSSIAEFIAELELPDSLPLETLHTPDNAVQSSEANVLPSASEEIQVNSLVYLIGDPETKGIVVRIDDRGTIKKYDVFVHNGIQSFYSGQIALVETPAGYEWASLDTIRSYLTAYQINNPSSQNLYSLNSARIDFVPYQFRPALKLIHADEPRILIADSVGVGKTIEAGLIIKELEARSSLERVAIICPRPLVAERKWELEMKRFDEEFIPLDGPTLRQIISDTDRDGAWPVRYSKTIIPYSILDSRAYLGDDQRRTRSFGLSELDPAPHFDLVIVDEAHHIRNGSMDKDKAFAYKCTKFFCDHADAVVMLTATPLQTSDNDLFTLLNLLRPDIVIDQKTFTMMSRPNEFISRASRIVRAAKEGWPEQAADELFSVQKTQWGDNVIAENPLFQDILSRLQRDSFSREDRVRLISDIESLHSFHTMLNRTRRRDIQDFCVRRSHTISTEFTAYQRTLHDALLRFEEQALAALHDARSVPFMMSTIKRQAASCIFGLAPHIRDILERRIQQMNDDPEVDASGFSLEGASSGVISSMAQHVLELADHLPEEDPKFEKTLQLIEAKQALPNNKIMLFSTFRHTLAYLKRRLAALGFRVEQIDGSVPDEQRYELKSRFELPKENADAVDILLFTEVGSEGLDYQFCDMMINYDLPWNPMRIEQRIGRIDRRGQQSEAVNIYNIITEGTVDADIYYRCLMRIGVFESSIGECEEILGRVAAEIETIVLDPTLTDAERSSKLEQIADNEVRRAQELHRLEDEERELFGFDLTEFTTAQEIRSAENPWLSQPFLQRLVEQYFRSRIGSGTYLFGETALKNLRLSATARSILRDDLRALPGGRTELRRAWESFLSGRNPNHPITFDAEAAAKNRESFFITAMHPLAKQAAAYFAIGNTAHLCLQYSTSDIPAGTYLFSVFAWKYTGVHSHTRLVTISQNDAVSDLLPEILECASSIQPPSDSRYDWSELEDAHVQMWAAAREEHKRNALSTVAFKLESLENNHRNRVRCLEQRIHDSLDESIRRMYLSELETANERHEQKVQEIQREASTADIFATSLVEGIITITEGTV